MTPSLSVVVPVYNEREEDLATTLTALTHVAVGTPVTFTATQHLGTTELYIVQPVAKAFKTLATCPYGSDASLGKCEAAS